MSKSWTSHELERRRCLAVERANDGYTHEEIAEFLGVSTRSVRRWIAAYRRGGFDNLTAQPRPGRPPKLNVKQTETVLSWFQRSPTAFGFRTELWTAQRVTQLIQKQFGVSFNHRYICDWLSGRNITPQKPRRRPRERDQARIDAWIATDWPRILKKGLAKTHTSF